MTAKYRAFVSYAHGDAHWARWLQSALERYRPPPHVRPSDPGSVGSPGRLYPIFRDRDELPSSTDLTRSIQRALEDSAALIVICSPAAAASRWVNEEIRSFQRLGRGQHIHCLLVAGSPERDDPECAFPPALLTAEDGRPLPEPLAADVNPAYDGKRGAMLKIAAGLLGLGYDDLVQRDAQRQLRRRSFWTAGAMAVALAMLGFAISAEIARNEAELRRGQAEDLISFMLGDLRSRLEPLGRLDVLDSVGDEATQYFETLGDRGTRHEVFARVMALRQIGEVRFRQGRFGPAQTTFEESRDLAESLLASEPESKELMFEAGQAEFWVGYAALEQADLIQAETSFERYMDYSRRLLDAEPENPDYLAELSYAVSNLGTVSLERAKVRPALDYFTQSVELNQQLVDQNPGDVGLRVDLGNGYSWLGATHLRLGQLPNSQAAYQRAVDVLTEVHGETASPIHAEYLAQNEYHLGNVHAHRGELQLAEEQFRIARRLLDGLVAHDPDNAIWRVDRAISAYHLGELSRVIDDVDLARDELLLARSDLSQLLSIDPADIRSARFLALTERSLGLLENSPDLIVKANERASVLVADIEVLKPGTALVAAMVAESYGHVLLESGSRDSATAAWTEALDLLVRIDDSGLTHQALRHALLVNLDQDSAAAPIRARLHEAGFRDPRFYFSEGALDAVADASGPGDPLPVR